MAPVLRIARGTGTPRSDVAKARPYVIWSEEHRAWWRPDRWGYTRTLARAGRYTRAEAVEIVTDANVVAVMEEMLTLAEAEADEARHGPRALRRGAGNGTEG